MQGNYSQGFSGGSVVKNLPVMQETWVCLLGWEDLLEKEVPTPGFLPGKILWTEGPGRFQFMGCQGVGHDLVTKQQQLLSIYDNSYLLCLLKIIFYNNNWTMLYNNDISLRKSMQKMLLSLSKNILILRSL